VTISRVDVGWEPIGCNVLTRGATGPTTRSARRGPRTQTVGPSSGAVVTEMTDECRGIVAPRGYSCPNRRPAGTGPYRAPGADAASTDGRGSTRATTHRTEAQSRWSTAAVRRRDRRVRLARAAGTLGHDAAPRRELL